MAELREVFEMTTKQMEPDQDSWNEQERRQRRTARNRKVGAFAVAAAIGVAAVVVVLATRLGDNATTPGSGHRRWTQRIRQRRRSPRASSGRSGPSTRNRRSPIWPTTPTSRYVGGGCNVEGNSEEMPLYISFLEAVGYKQMLDSVRGTGQLGLRHLTSMHVRFPPLRVR